MKINEIFYSIQGEGFHTGTPAVFIRFSGCNLKCPFCDTKHQDGEEMAVKQITDKVSQYPAKMVVLTGGEPGLQITPQFVRELKMIGKYVAVETNGTIQLPINVDWVTCSPKSDFVRGGNVLLNVPYTYNELKVVYDGNNDVDQWLTVKASHYYLQPCDTGNKEKNEAIIQHTIAHCLGNPKWRISLQTQKILNVR